MQIAYHATGSSLTAAALDDAIAAAISGWPSVGSLTLVTLRDPSFPFHFEKTTTSDDRTTMGGRQFSVVRFSGQQADMQFSGMTESEVAAWRTFYDATLGFRLPFVVEHPMTLQKYAMQGAQAFPFKLTTRGAYDGSVRWQQAL